MRHFEDFRAGDIYEYGAFHVTAESITAFAREFDPQPFHLDEAAAKTSLLGGLAASGWQTCAIAMRLHCQHLLPEVASLGSPGVPEMRWLKPVRKDAVVRLRTRITALRRSRSRPGVGIAEVETRMLDHSDQEVMSSRGVLFLACRDAPAGLALHEGGAPANGEVWRKPDALLSEPADAPDDDGLISGWLDDVRMGRTVDLGVHRFDGAAIQDFARQWDPQPFHIDEAAARAGPFGRLAASGWHIGAAGMARHMLTREAFSAQGERRGIEPPPRGPSPGFRDMRWREPVFAGDEIHYYMTPQASRATARPGWGMLFNRFEGVNQHGRKVYDYVSAALWPTRPK